MRFLALLILSFGTLGSWAQPVPPIHFDEPTTSVENKSKVQSLLDQYFSQNSVLKKNDRAPLPLQNSDLAVHLFQLGPSGETFFPEIQLKVGNRCESSRPFEFAVRVEKKDGKHQISQVSMLVGPSYAFKERTDSQTGKRRFNLTDLILGPLGIESLDAGAMSLTFAPPRLKELLEKGRIRVQAVLDENGKFQSYQIKQYSQEGKLERAYSRTPDLKKDSVVSVVDPDTGKPLSAIAMPYSVYFAPREKGYLESKTWQKIAPTGTAIHGADWAHLNPRSSSNLGSAGCARVQTDFAEQTFLAIRQHLEKNGAQSAQTGSVVDVSERDMVSSDGKRNGQQIVETPANAANLEAFLKSREKISMQGFVPVSAEKMARFYGNEFWLQLQRVFSSKVDISNTGDLAPKFQAYNRMQWDHYNLGQRLSQLQAEYNQAPNKRRFFSKARPKPEVAQEIYNVQSQMAQISRLFPQLENEIVNGLSALESTRRSELDPELQRLIAIRQKVTEYEELAEKVRKEGRPGAPLADVDSEVRAFYESPEMRTALYRKAAEAMEAYYKNRFGEKIPQPCLDHLARYKRAVARPAHEAPQDLPAPRAIPVAEQE